MSNADDGQREDEVLSILLTTRHSFVTTEMAQAVTARGYKWCPWDGKGLCPAASRKAVYRVLNRLVRKKLVETTAGKQHGFHRVIYYYAVHDDATPRKESEMRSDATKKWAGVYRDKYGPAADPADGQTEFCKMEPSGHGRVKRPSYDDLVMKVKADPNEWYRIKVIEDRREFTTIIQTLRNRYSHRSYEFAARAFPKASGREGGSIYARYVGVE